jgi:type II restriction enzyme
LICDFCGYLAQVKAASVANIGKSPKTVMGAAWGPQKSRMDAGIYFPLYLVLVERGGAEFAIYYLAADLQPPHIFQPRKPLSSQAKRAGWQGFLYEVESVADRFVKLK